MTQISERPLMVALSPRTDLQEAVSAVEAILWDETYVPAYVTEHIRLAVAELVECPHCMANRKLVDGAPLVERELTPDEARHVDTARRLAQQIFMTGGAPEDALVTELDERFSPEARAQITFTASYFIGMQHLSKAFGARR